VFHHVDDQFLADAVKGYFQVRVEAVAQAHHPAGEAQARVSKTFAEVIDGHFEPEVGAVPVPVRAKSGAFPGWLRSAVSG
jgi:hypothetical protein